MHLLNSNQNILECSLCNRFRFCRNAKKKKDFQGPYGEDLSSEKIDPCF